MNKSASISTTTIRRWMYGETIRTFLHDDEERILGTLTRHSTGNIEIAQRNAWSEQVRILRSLNKLCDNVLDSRIYLEFTVPRLGRRADVVLLIRDILFIIEFKVGESVFNSFAIDQVWDYALDFKNFHETSHDICIVPILIATKASKQTIEFTLSNHGDKLTHPICISADQIVTAITECLQHFNSYPIDVANWESGRYKPTPTIVEAAKALYAGHSVKDISRSDAGAKNLTETTAAIDSIIEKSRIESRKAICFVTGVPGAGKTLVGLDVANRHLDPKSEAYSVFLSGNGPLVAVLREALTRDRINLSVETGKKMKKGEAKKEVEAFIQNVHHFRDEYLRDTSAPPEHVVLFDEAQRAWNLKQTSSFMLQKKGTPGFDKSEPEFLISCLDRHEDWAVVICLVGSGQEINTGEGGINQWFEAILNKYSTWDAHLSPSLAQAEFQGGPLLAQVLNRSNTHINECLHLATSMRSFRAETLSKFVYEVLSLEVASARQTLRSLSDRYPIRITRDLSCAKAWLRQQARGSERFGMVVSSQAERLKPHAIDVRVKTDPVKWFLEGKEDTRSSYYLEDVATEFQVQGLELDWTCVVWDGDLRFNDGKWAHHQFRGSRWNRIKNSERQQYLENAYRVLLTRARQGMILVVPEGDDTDPTRARSFYDPTFEYLSSLGIQEL